MAEVKLKAKDKIKKALAELMENKTVEDITTTALCKHAGVNRATFYYHYDSVEAVLSEIETQMETEFVRFLSSTTPSSGLLPDSGFIVKFFEFAARNASVCRMILKSKKTDFLDRALEAGRTKVVSIMTKPFPACPLSKIDLYYVFVSHGFIGLLEYWLDSGMRESTSFLAEVGEKVAYTGMGFLK